MNDKSLKEKLDYIMTYYARDVIVIGAAIIFILFMLFRTFFGQSAAFNIMAVNTVREDDMAASDESFYSDFLTEAGIDGEEILITDTLGVTADEEDSASLTNMTTIQNRLNACSVDILFGDEDFIYSLGEFDYLTDLSTVLSEEILETYADSLVYTISLESGEEYPVGILLEGNTWIESTGWYDTDDVVVCLPDGAKHLDLGIMLLDDILI